MNKKLSVFLLIPTLGFSTCLGPEEIIANAPVHPYSCNGQWVLSISGFYWNAHQDGMEFAIDTAINVPVINPTSSELQELNHLIDARYETPKSHWEFGFKLGLGYNSTCDGWDIGLLWTHYHTRSFTHLEAEPRDNHSLIALWSAFAPAHGGVTFARDIEAAWTVDLDLVDVELGRAFWISRHLSLRPFVGLRYAKIDQSFYLEHKGGSWSPRMSPIQDPFTGEIDVNNDYDGIGLRTGLNTFWHLGCGFGIYGNLAASIIYGRFNVDHDEQNRLVIEPHSKCKIMQTEDVFRASRAILDFGLGVEWSRRFCNCSYGITARFGWEQHLFFHQNQMWRVVRSLDAFPPGPFPNVIGDSFVNNTGENLFQQRRGNLDTQGWTLTLVFDF